MSNNNWNHQFGRRRTFGFAVFFCLLASLAKAQTSVPPETVTVCSYNLKNWLTTPAPSVASPDSETRSKPESEKAQVVSYLHKIQPDILGVCEIGSEEDLTDLQSRLRAVGIDLPHSELVTGEDPVRGLGLLSRFPIVDRNPQTQLNYQLGKQRLYMQRGILDVTVSISDSFPLRLLGVHLKSKRQVPDADESLMRRNEAHLLRRYLDTIFTKSPNSNVLCYGDFNENRNGPAILEIMGNRAGPGRMQDIPLRDRHGLVWTQFWDAADVYSRFDYFFVSRSLRGFVDTKSSYIFGDPNFARASDHRPIVLELRLKPSTRSSKQ